MPAKPTKDSSICTDARLRLRTDLLLTDLANLMDDGILQFRTKWERFYGRDRYPNEVLLARRDELRMLWAKRFARLPVGFSLEDFRDTPGLPITERSEQLYSKWQICPGESLQQFICEYWLGLNPDSWVVSWGHGKKNIRANPRSLAAVLAWACVFHADRLHVCKNSGCAGPYFIASRRDQKFCTKECALPSQRAAKLKWWHDRRGKKV